MRLTLQSRTTMKREQKLSTLRQIISTPLVMMKCKNKRSCWLVPKCIKKRQEFFEKFSKNFQIEGIALLPHDGMLRKVVVIVSRGIVPYSTDQLVKVCEHMFEKLPFFVFKGPADSHPYVVVIFSPNCQYGDVCEVKTRMEICKKKAAVDNFLFVSRWSLCLPLRNISNISWIDQTDSSLETKTVIWERS